MRPATGPNTLPAARLSSVSQSAPAKRAARIVSSPRKRTTTLKSPLEVIPGIGSSIAADLNRIGIHDVAQLKGEDPQRLFDHLCAHDGVKHDRCVLYVFRCAVYYASRRRHDPEKLKWWNWKSA